MDDTAKFWSTVGVSKRFTDPFFVERFATFVSPDAPVIEYGCGYGRIMKVLKEKGFSDVVGFDISRGMIDRGRRDFPDLQFKLLDQSANISLQDEAVAGVIISTVLCNVYEKHEQKKIFDELYRILCVGGVIYFSDFLITESDHFRQKYKNCGVPGEEYGVYKTSEGLLARHHQPSWVQELLSPFELQCYDQFEHETMNGNPVRAFYAIAMKTRI